MLISADKEENLFCLEIAKGSMKPSLMDLRPDSSNGLSSDSDSVYTDVRIVPEHLKSELEQSKSNLEGEIADLKSKLRSLNEKRREGLNKMIDLKGSIRVFCRVRPVLKTERRQVRECVSVGSNNIVVRSAGHKKEFGFDKVLHQAASQEDVYAEVKPILRSALDGRNVCVLAYGQTGTGKTFTMDGTDEQPGIVPRALEELYLEASLDYSHSVTYKMSMMEIYMGNLKDLLAQRLVLRSYEAAPKCNLNIQTDSKGVVEIEGLTEVQIPNLTRAKWWYNKGRRVRSTSWTNVNDASSRSHCLTRITISRRGDGVGAKTEISKLWMIDLGGSERTLKTGAIGQTLDEGRAINLSLSAFGDVIAALRRKKVHVPYRNSKLTQILRDSLGNGSKVLMLVHISPCEDDVGETICSLSFTKRARGVESHRELSEELRKIREKRISELEEELIQAEEECTNIKTQLQNAEFRLSENKKLFSTTYELSQENAEEDKQNSTTENLKKAIETPKTSEKAAIKTNKSYNFVPRFMAATVASRQRQNASEKEVQEKARSLKSATRSSSIQFSTSQSLNLSDHRSRKYTRSSILKPHKAETPETPKVGVSEAKTASLVKTKMVTSSDPNVRATISRHRRRMSSLI